MAVARPDPCPLCSELRPLSHEVLVRWRAAPWDTTTSAKDPSTHHDRWLAACAECASAAALFRVEYPRAAAQHRRDTLRLVVIFGAALFLLVGILWGGRSLLSSDPAEIKLLYGAGWLVLGIVTVFLILYGLRVLNYGMASRQPWGGQWVVDRLAQALELPTGDQAPYWWEIDLEGSLESRSAPDAPPLAPPPPPRSLEPPPKRLGPTPNWPSATEW
ncbi:MAG TPA: hypothetical protein VEI97_06070 [bacterium]|nr:hypothetical protein [bacterium]